MTSLLIYIEMMDVRIISVANTHDTQLFIDDDLVPSQDPKIKATRWSWPKILVNRRDRCLFSTANWSLLGGDAACVVNPSRFVTDKLETECVIGCQSEQDHVTHGHLR